MQFIAIQIIIFIQPRDETDLVVARDKLGDVTSELIL
jgi:hypothetical protein